MTVNLITLGCSKNLVDSERLLAQLRARGYQVMHNDYEKQARVVILNTCGFILDAKEESIDAILEQIAQKKAGKVERIFVMGCLSERYRAEVQAEMPEVDGFFGVWDFPAIMKAMGSSLDQKLLLERELATPGHYAYLKISEGCLRSCAFCAIPGIRGTQQSLSINDLVKESQALAAKGVKELILIAQDLTNYGLDLYRYRALPELLKALVKIEGIHWIRLHYAYPSGFPEEVIELMSREKKICNYLDIPIQHVNDEVLQAMGRGHNREQLDRLLNRFRRQIPDLAIRTTILSGFPGEREEAHRELLEYIKDFRFDRLGVFSYSHEEDTPAYARYSDNIPSGVKMARAAEIMELQQTISLELNESKIGKTYEVLIDRVEADYYIGRTAYDSPEVDNEILIHASAELEIGEFYQVKMTGADAFDLYGKI